MVVVLIFLGILMVIMVPTFVTSISTITCSLFLFLYNTGN